MNVSSPIALLPAEILDSIFTSGLEPYTLRYETSPTSRQGWLRQTCLTCRLWKDISYSNPELWNLLYILHSKTQRKDRQEASNQRLSLHLQRAKNAPLHVYLTIETPELPSQGCTGFWRLWEEVRERSQQWRSMCILGLRPHTAADMYRLLPTSLPNLVEADVDVGDLHSVLTPAGIVSAPQLRFYRPVDAQGAAPEAPAPFVSLSSIEILHVSGFFKNIRNLLQAAPHVRTLLLKYCLPALSESLRDVELHSLHHINTRGTPVDIWRLLRCLTAPNLQMLSMTVSGKAPTEPIDVSDRLLFPSLATIEYQPVAALYFAPLRFLLSGLQEARSLTIKFTWTEPLERPVVQSIEEVEADIQWMEARVFRVVWLGMENQRVLESELWKDARRAYGKAGQR